MWWVLPYLGMVGRCRGDDPCFGVFNPMGSLFYTSALSDWPPLSAEKIGWSPSHLVPEILGHKIDLCFIKMYYLTDLKYFVWIFSMIFNPIEPLFIDFKSFWPPFSQNLRFNWLQFVFACWIRLPKIWWRNYLSIQHFSKLRIFPTWNMKFMKFIQHEIHLP